MSSKKRGDSALPTQCKTSIFKYLANGGPRLLRGEAVEVVRFDRSVVAGLLVLTAPGGVVLETATDELTVIPLCEVRTLRRPRHECPSRRCFTDGTTCGSVTLCRVTRGWRATV